MVHLRLSGLNRAHLFWISSDLWAKLKFCLTGGRSQWILSQKLVFHLTHQTMRSSWMITLSIQDEFLFVLTQMSKRKLGEAWEINVQAPTVSECSGSCSLEKSVWGGGLRQGPFGSKKLDTQLQCHKQYRCGTPYPVSSQKMGGVVFMITAKPYLEQPRLLLFIFVLVLWHAISWPWYLPVFVTQLDKRAQAALLSWCIPRTLGLPAHLFPLPQMPSSAGGHLPRCQTPLNSSPYNCFLLFFVSHQRFSFHPGLIFYKTEVFSRLVFPLDQKQKKTNKPKIPFHSSLCPFPLPHSLSE